MSYDANIKQYLREYQNEYNAAMRGGQHTAELSFRVPIDNMLRRISHDLNPEGRFDVILEPRNQGRVGRPDWRIQDSISLGIYGYIEGKPLTVEVFDTAPYQGQINRYLTLGHKLIITDGIDFVFCFSETPVTVSIINKAEMNAPDWSRLTVDPRFKFYMEQFFSNPSAQHINEEKLVELVAIRTRILADSILDIAGLSIDEALNEDEQRAIMLLNGLKELVYNHNDPVLRTGEVFADFVAQVIMFCLLYAHRVICTSDDTPAEKAIKIREYAFNDIVDEEELLPFRNLMIYLRDNEGTETFIGQWVEECIAFLSFVHMTENQLMNPDYHRLFELFLNKFDKQVRFDYGAFYTPKILADFIVRLTNKIVEENYNGISIYDEGNTIIDPCCGTGSFLEQIIEHDNTNAQYNLCGFEILPAPYMLANYRMALVRKQHEGRDLRPSIILANTLSNCLLGEDANTASIEGRELQRASDLSSTPLRLIIGNPPCSDSIRNNVTNDCSEIIALTDDFRPPAEGRHGRQNTQKQINNPFMQFLRWSCVKLSLAHTHSVLSFVVPLSFLEAESYKYARKFLVEHFSGLWAIAIDSDARTGVRGDSVFNTMQGRAAIILIKRADDNTPISEVNFLDISRARKEQKEAVFENNIDETIRRFDQFTITNAMYSFIPSRPFNEELYASFWPVSTDKGSPGIFLYQCSGQKMTPTALNTHVKKSMLKRRCKEIATEGIAKANEWIGKQDKAVPNEKIAAFQRALQTCSTPLELEEVLNESIKPCSFRPFLNSNALLWDTIFDFQKGVAGDGARPRPELKAVYNLPDTFGFSLAHAPKDLDESLGQFTSFCWYFPDNDLSKRGNGHIYLNQYIRDPQTNEVSNNIHSELIRHLSEATRLSTWECAKKTVFYTYAIFCSQVYLEEFYGALFVVNQSESRARIPIVNNKEVFMTLAELGEQLALLERNDYEVENILAYDYESILNQLPVGFHLEHSRSSAKSPYDEENDQFIVRDETTGTTIRVYCPVALQKFTVAGYNVIKDCWLKFHSYRFTHCDFTRDDFRKLLDLFNRIAKQMTIVNQVDEIVHSIVDGSIPLLSYAGGNASG